MLFPAIFINVIQLTTKSLYFWDSLQIMGDSESIDHNDELVNVVISQLSPAIANVFVSAQIFQTNCYDGSFLPLSNIDSTPQ